MTEEELATRAPENDAAEDTVALEQPATESGPALGEHCVTDRPTPSGEKPSGEITKIKDVEVYITKPADYPHSPSKFLFLLTGGTGIHSTNNQLQADKYAAEGFLVVMPDQFNGDPSPTSAGPLYTEAGEAQHGWLERSLDTVKTGIAVVAKSTLIDMWLARHTPAKVLPLLHKVLEAAQEEYADAVSAGGGVYCVGYCFGAKYALMLGGEGQVGDAKSEDGNEDEKGGDPAFIGKAGPLIKTAAIAHGTQIAPEDIAGLQVPTCFICVEDDPLFPNEVRVQGIAELEKKALKHEVKVYPEVPHGFAVYGDYQNAKIKEAQKMAFSQMLTWLKAN